MLLFDFKYFDPGLMQTRKAIKSTLALLITLFIIFFWVPKIGVLFACIGAMFITVCSEGGNTKKRVNSLFIASMGFFIALTLGWLLYPYTIIANIVLILLTFIAFYIRRFGARYLLFPPTAVVIYLLAISFPVQSMRDGLFESLAMLIAGVVAIMVFLSLWRDQSPLLSVRHQMSRIFKRYDTLLTALINDIERNAPVTTYRHQRELLVRLGEDLSDMFTSLGKVTLQHYTQTWVEQFWVKQFAFYKALTMVWESLLQLSKNENHVELNHDQIIIQLLAIQHQLHNISDAYCQFHTKNDITPLSEITIADYGNISQDTKQTIHLLNFIFALNRCSELLAICGTMLNDNVRWVKGRAPQ